MKLLKELTEARWTTSRRNYRGSRIAKQTAHMLNQADRHPEGYRVGKQIRGNRLKRGMKLAAFYSRHNEGVDYIEVLGFTGNHEKYGEGGVKYNSVQDIFRAHRGISTLKALEASDNEKEYGYSHYMCARDIDPKSNATGQDREGCWYYLFGGRWSRGSGAEPLSFYEIQFAPVQDDTEEDEYLGR